MYIFELHRINKVCCISAKPILIIEHPRQENVFRIPVIK